MYYNQLGCNVTTNLVVTFALMSVTAKFVVTVVATKLVITAGLTKLVLTVDTTNLVITAITPKLVVCYDTINECVISLSDIISGIKPPPFYH